jgi:hypothetical protein
MRMPISLYFSPNLQRNASFCKRSVLDSTPYPLQQKHFSHERCFCFWYFDTIFFMHVRIKFILALLSIVTLLGAGCDNPRLLQNETTESVATTTHNIQKEFFDNSTLEKTVRQIFDKIDSKEYLEAYSHFSYSFQKSHPFSEWSDGYKGTLGHTVTSVNCENRTCIADLIATEVAQEDIHKQRYVFRYGFVADTSGQPIIDYGMLLSSSLVEVMTSFAEPIQEEAPVPYVAPASSPIPIYNPTPTPQRYCCKYCTKGKACGDSCISRSYTCHKGPGCACDTY